MASVSDEITSDKLIDLRVVDLRSELEKRGLDKTGVKAVLLERLEKALKSEEQNRKNTEGRNEEKSDLSDLVKIETLSEEKRQEENQSEDKIEHTTENMDEKESDTSNMALVDVFLNINNPDIDPLLPDKTSGEDLAEDQLLSSDTKPSDMLVNDTFDKDQFVEELPITALDTNKDNSTVLQEESDDPLKDTGALPEQSSSSTEANTKEENSGKSSSASVRIATPPLNSKDEVVVTALSDSLPPTPTSVPRKAPFALKGTVSMDTSTTQQSEENESLIVHVDDTQNDLDADLVASKTNKAKMDKASKDKVSGKTEVKKTDGSTVEGRAKGKTEGGQTEKKADEKKDVKSKSSSVYESKFAKNVKSNNQNSRNLRVRGFARYTSVADLRTIFAKYGKVVNVKIVGKTHCAVVTMSKPAEALKCSMWLNQTIVNGMKLTVVREVRQIKHKTRNIKVREKRSKNFRVTLKIQKELEQKQRAETIRLDKVRERLRFEKMKLEKEKLSRYRMEKELLEIERHNVEMRCAEMLRIEEMTRSMQRPLDRGNPHEEGLWDDPKRPRMLNSRNPSRFERPFKNEPWLEKMKLEKEKLSRYRMEKELLEIERHNVEMHCDEMLRMEEMTRSMQRPLDRGNPHEEGLWDDPKRPGMFNSRNPSRFERPFKNEPCYNRYEEPDYGRPIERFDRRKSRNIGSHFDEYKEREMRRKIDLFRDIRVRVDRRHNDRFLSDDNLNRMPSDFRRDMGPSGEPDRRYIGSDRGRDIDRQTIPAHERLGRVRSSPVGGPDQRSPWGSGSINKKVDNWSHMHGDMGNSGMNRFNEPWHGNPMDKTGRDASGAFVVSGKPGNSGGMGQNMGPGNMFGNSQSQGGIMMNTYSGGNFGGNNMSGHIQQPRFNA